MPSERYLFTPALKRVVVGSSIFLLTMVMAVMGYLSFGWSTLDAFYMYVITVFGVGYGEVRPLVTPQQRIFNMIVIVTGTTSAIYTVGAVLQMVTEGELKRLLDVQRTVRDISKLKGHVIICGFGRIGQVMAQELAAIQIPFIILDVDEERISLAEKLGYLVYFGNATEEDALRGVGIDRAIALASVLPNDTMNVFITLTARYMNDKLLILARANVPATEAKLRMAGADHVVLPTRIGASQMANLIRRPRNIDFLEQTGDRQGLNQLLHQIHVELVEMEAMFGDAYIGSPLQNLEVRGAGQFIVIGLRKPSGQLFPARTNPTIAVGDTLILLGHAEDRPKFVRELKRRPVT